MGRVLRRDPGRLERALPALHQLGLVGGRLGGEADDRLTVPARGDELGEDVEYLYFVGCAGSLEERSRKTARAFATLLHVADVKFAILGQAETCNGDPARRIGNEFVFQMLAQHLPGMVSQQANG